MRIQYIMPVHTDSRNYCGIFIQFRTDESRLQALLGLYMSLRCHCCEGEHKGRKAVRRLESSCDELKQAEGGGFNEDATAPPYGSSTLRPDPLNHLQRLCLDPNSLRYVLDSDIDIPIKLQFSTNFQRFLFQ